MRQPRVVHLAIRSIAGAALMLLAGGLPATLEAQPHPAYPARAVRIVVPFSAGSPIETPARIIAQHLLDALGQSFVIENRTGASGTIGTDLVAKAPPDGYTLLFTNCSHSSNAAHYRRLPYDALADFAPITQSNVTYGNILVVHPSVPARSVKEFIALARAYPGKLNYASAGIGSPPHVAGALFASVAAIQLMHVPYKGTAVAFNDVLGGHVEVMFASPTHIHPYVEAGRVRPLGIGGPRRTPILPDVPTFAEIGVSGAEATCYHGMWFPAGVPAEIVRRVNRAAVRAIALPEVRKYLEDNGLIPVGNSPEEFAQFLAQDIERQASIAKRIGITPQ